MLKENLAVNRKEVLPTIPVADRLHVTFVYADSPQEW